jgi:hypothetical protein
LRRELASDRLGDSIEIRTSADFICTEGKLSYDTVPPATMHPLTIAKFILNVKCKYQSLKTIQSREGSWHENYDAASGTILELVRIFIEACKIFVFIFLFDQADKKLKTSGAWT